MATPNHALPRFQGFNVHAKDRDAPVKTEDRLSADLLVNLGVGRPPSA